MNVATMARLERRLLEAWTAPAGEGALRTGPSTAVQTDYAGNLRVLSLEDGHVVHEDRVEPPGDNLPLPAFDAAGGFRVVSGNSVRAYDARGGLQWTTPLPGKLNREPAVAPDGTCYVQGDQEIHALDAEGTVRWSRPLERRSTWDAPVVTPEGTVVAADEEGAIVAFTPDGSEAWRNESLVRQAAHELSPVRTPLEMLPDGSVCFLSTNGSLYVLGPDGEERWNRDIHADPLESGKPEVDGRGNIYVANRGDLLAFDSEGRELFQQRFPAGPYPSAAPDAGVAVWVPQEGLRVLDEAGREEARFADQGSGHVAFLGPEDLLWKTQSHVRRLVSGEGWEAWAEAHPVEDLRIEQHGGSLTIGSIQLDVRD